MAIDRLASVVDRSNEVVTQRVFPVFNEIADTVLLDEEIITGRDWVSLTSTIMTFGEHFATNYAVVHVQIVHECIGSKCTRIWNVLQCLCVVL